MSTFSAAFREFIATNMNSLPIIIHNTDIGNQPNTQPPNFINPAIVYEASKNMAMVNTWIKFDEPKIEMRIDSSVVYGVTVLRIRKS